MISKTELFIVFLQLVIEVIKWFTKIHVSFEGMIERI